MKEHRDVLTMRERVANQVEGFEVYERHCYRTMKIVAEASPVFRTMKIVAEASPVFVIVFVIFSGADRVQRGDDLKENTSSRSS